MRFRDKIQSFFDKPQNTVAIFIVGMLIPNLVLAHTEPYSFTTIAASILLPAAFYLFWVIIFRHPGIMMLAAIPLMVLGAFQLVISYLFGNSIIAVDMFTNLFTTNVSEAGELLGNIYPSVIIVILIYVPLILIAIFSLKKKQKISASQQRNGFISVVILLVAGSIFAGISKYRNPDFRITHHIFPVNVCYNVKLSIERWNRSMSYPELSKNFSFNAERHKIDSAGREIYILVIGEASRAHSWQLFGYERETTPQLSGRNDIVAFTDVLTESNTTHKSVPIMLSPSSAESFEDIFYQKSVLEMFREGGFHTSFISNQPANRSLTDFFASQADTVINVTSHDIMVSENRYDGEILFHIDNVIKSTQKDLFLVIHTYGSHTSHIKRYPREFSHFTPDEARSVSRKNRDRIRNAYDNTIRYTDHVLSEIIRLLEATGECTAMVYCSDHGEDVLDDRRDRFLHASPTTTYYQLHIPAFAWFSGKYSNAFTAKEKAAVNNKDNPATTASVFHTIADIASISSPYLNVSYSLVSEDYKPYPRMYINDYDIALNIVNSGLDKEDFEMFDRKGITYDKTEIHKELF